MKEIYLKSIVDVAIRTNGGTLTINAASDTVNHYAQGLVLDIQAIGGSSYHEFGHFPKATIKQGRMVVEDKGQVEILNVTGSGVVLDEVGTGSVELCYASSNENVPTGTATVEPIVEPIELDNIVARTENGAYSTLSNALDNLGTSKTLYIVADFDETFTSAASGETMYNIQNPVTIDGQGHTINATFIINNTAVKEFIEFNASSTVKNLNINGTGVKYIIVAQAEATFENVNISADNACISAADTTGHAVARNCTFRFVKGEHTRNDHQEAWAPVSSQYGATLELFNCVLTSSDGYGMLIWPSGGTLEATKCSITSAKGYAVSWIRNGSTSNTPTDSIVRVNSCTIEGNTTCEAKYNSANPSGKEAYIYKDNVLVATTVTE